MSGEPRRALLLVDLQNDFIHRQGAYARGGATSRAIAEVPSRVGPLVEAARAAEVTIVATLFTLVQTPTGPLIGDHLARLRPFLAAGDFAPGSWGQDVVAEVAPADVTVEKVAYSAFHQSRLDFVLRQLGVTDLMVTGIVTNGGVASTVRAAHVLDYSTVVVSDGCAAFSDEAHEATIASLATVSEITTIEDARASF